MKNQNRLISIHGIPMLLHDGFEHISKRMIATGEFWEADIFKRWNKYFPTEGLILDIGANMGTHSLQLYKHSSKLKIWAFEIDYKNFELLRQNTINYPQISCFNFGIGSCNSTVNFTDGADDDYNQGGIRITHNGNNINMVVALDTFIFPEPVTFIKIDIEGHELSAFEGMTNLLLKDKPLIWLEDFNGNAINYLKNLGYEMLDSISETQDFLMKFK